MLPVPHPILDSNVSLSRWPFRRLPLDETPLLVQRLKQNGVRRAVAGSFDALLHRDIAAVNQRLAAECKQHGAGLLMPAGCVDPMLPDWKEELRRCHEVHGMKAIRLHPNYHGYSFTTAQARELLGEAAKRKLLVQVVCEMEDERTLHPRVMVKPVDWKPLIELSAADASLRLQLLNVRGLPAVKGKNIWVDFAMTEGVHGLQNLAQAAGADRVVFGSHAPFYYFESALLKVTESGMNAAAICEDNARRMLGETV